MTAEDILVQYIKHAPVEFLIKEANESLKKLQEFPKSKLHRQQAFFAIMTLAVKIDPHDKSVEQVIREAQSRMDWISLMPKAN